MTWGITASGTGPQKGNPPYNLTESEPYTTDPALLHSVLDGVATAIEAVQSHCSSAATPVAAVAAGAMKTDDVGYDDDAAANPLAGLPVLSRPHHSDGMGNSYRVDSDDPLQIDFARITHSWAVEIDPIVSPQPANPQSRARPAAVLSLA